MRKSGWTYLCAMLVFFAALLPIQTNRDVDDWSSAEVASAVAPTNNDKPDNGEGDEPPSPEKPGETERDVNWTS